MGPTPTRRFKHKQGAVFGTSMKNDKAEDSPGPGNYDPLVAKDSTKNRAREALILGSEDRHGYIHASKSPGPGHYQEVGNPTMSSSRGAARGSGFSLALRKTEFDTVIAQSARAPGPGAYSGVEKKETGHTIGIKREKKPSMNPGPGAYNVEVANVANRPQTAKAASFAQGARPDIWREDKNKATLGPGYENMRSSFDQTMKKGPTMGGKIASKALKTPGPGSYDNHNLIAMTKKQGASIKIHGGPKRPDHFVSKKELENPGPGNYDGTYQAFGKNTKGAASMGSKYKPERNTNPGPGQYSAEQVAGARKYMKNSGKIGSEARPDVWAKDTKRDVPGPGNYLETTGTFGKNTKGAANMGSKHRADRNTNPGPGQYDSGFHKTMRPTSSYGKMGTMKRNDLWNADKQTKEGRPGPGQHTQSYSSFSNTKANNFGATTARKAAKNQNPGPGQYNESGRTMMHTKSASVRFGSQHRPDLFTHNQKEQMPGPGGYEDETNTFGKAAKGGANMGSKYKPERNMNPGPGEYDADHSKMKNNANSSVRIGQEARGDIWQKEMKADVPGPGGYQDKTNTFGQAAKGGANMGSKFKPERNMNPGPGQYDADPSKIQVNAHGSIHIGQEKRADIWQNEANYVPGPGGYEDETNTFGKAVKGGAANMGSKYKPVRNNNPGPAQYEVSDSMTKKAGMGQRISKAQRKEIWEAQLRNGDVPGPGNYQENTSSFAQIKGGGVNMGSKFRETTDLNPGPGQYEQALYDMSNHQTKNMKIGTEKARSDIFSVEQAGTVPGPGAYESPEKLGKGFTIGSKRSDHVEHTPGVGSYNVTSELVVAKDATFSMSQAKREDLWKDEIKGGQTPGPGSSDLYDNDTPSGGFVFNKDDRFPRQKESAPGPGTYELLDD